MSLFVSNTQLKLVKYYYQSELLVNCYLIIRSCLTDYLLPFLVSYFFFLTIEKLITIWLKVWSQSDIKSLVTSFSIFCCILRVYV